MIRSEYRVTAQKLQDYARRNDWAGYDPYDALNSPLFRRLPIFDFRVARLIFTQVLKRSPINARKLLLIPKTQNPKAIALFLAAILKLSRVGFADQDVVAKLLIDRLVALRSPGRSSWCWGYSFPWQTRTLLVPRAAPNVVCTTFVAEALMDAYDELHDSRCLSMATSAAEYMVQEFFWEEGDSIASFSYPHPGTRSKIYNANLLGAALLCRIHRETGDERLLTIALRLTRFAVDRQNEDGSWKYGDEHSQGWVDNFHTGYNLCALKAIGQYVDTREFETNLNRGFEFYRSHFFRGDGAPKYFHDRTYPIDIHCVAQSILTLVEFKDLRPGNLDLARRVFDWAMDHMWDDEGFFYYRVLRVGTVRIPYMRWSQAWMLLAIASLALESSKGSLRGDSEPRSDKNGMLIQ